VKVAYLLTRFPVVSETFILNEIVEALHQGVDIRVFSELPPNETCPHGKLKHLEGRIEYLPSLESSRPLKTMLLHLRFFLKRPLPYLKTFAYALRNRHLAMLWAFKVCVHFARRLDEFRPDVIHTHFASHTARFALLVSRLLGIPYTLTIHGWYDLYKAPPSYMRELVMNSLKTVTVCEFNRKHLEREYDIPHGMIEVLMCGIEVDSFTPGVEDQKEGGLILSVGRLHFHKAYHHLIDACRILKEKGVEFKCWVIGEGELREKLQDRINKLDLKDRVALLGMKSNEEVAEYLKRAQVFTLSSEVEVVGIVFMEAMASCLPVVAPSVFGVPELVEHGKTGLLYDPGDSATLARHLAYLLDHPEVRKEMGLKGREKVRREHDLQRQVSRLVGIWAKGAA